MEYVIRLVQVHESFRKAEILALAVLADINVDILEYYEYSPFCIIRLEDEDAARALIRRSILSQNIYELWGSGASYDDLHARVRTSALSKWTEYSTCSFRFDIDTYQGKRSPTEQRRLIESFDYLDFNGPIKMQSPEQRYCIFEDYDFRAPTPRRVHLGRWIAGSDRDAMNTYSLKTRKYISTTSMDAELSLVTANLTLAAPGRIFYDPFVGTGSFPIACAHFGAMVLGSDIDGRSLRGTRERTIISNFEQYGLTARFVDNFIADLTNTPLRGSRLFDGIVCDPPYGVREGLKVLGSRDGKSKEILFVDGEATYLRAEYIPPKRPYSFEAMLNNILDFAASSLVDNGRVSFWMPTANDEDVSLGIPTHPCLEMVTCCVQTFTKCTPPVDTSRISAANCETGSRRLLTYRRLPEAETKAAEPRQAREGIDGATADDLNAFRKRYFQGFKSSGPEPTEPEISRTRTANDQ